MQMKALLYSLGLLVITAITVLLLSSQMPAAGYGLQLWLLTPILVSVAVIIALQRKGKLRRLFPVAAVIINALAILPYLGMQAAESQGERAVLLLVMVPLYQGIALLLVGLTDYVRRREAKKNPRANTD
jgi:NO-binding membrane sensor protein with MHYT domain